MNLAQLKTIEAELKHEIYGLNKVFFEKWIKQGWEDIYTRDYYL
jgi:hypothetical protein